MFDPCLVSESALTSAGTARLANDVARSLQSLWENRDATLAALGTGGIGAASALAAVAPYSDRPAASLSVEPNRPRT
ncbi:hypothetical protein ACF1BP_29280 [Streptomyces sp. NPDC014735]|uniref:hypothetical protein n=1 Tax=unclassified Streptomyces TaxID=2593676 RepID=UPI0036F515A3